MCLQLVGRPFARSSPNASLPAHVHRETPCASIPTHTLAGSPDSSRRQACRRAMNLHMPGIILICYRPREPAQLRNFQRHWVATVVRKSCSLANVTELLCAKCSPIKRLSPRLKLRSASRPDSALCHPRPRPGPRRICPRTTTSLVPEGVFPADLSTFCETSSSPTSMSALSLLCMLPSHLAPVPAARSSL